MESEENIILCPNCKGNLLDFAIQPENGLDNAEKFFTQYTCDSCGHQWRSEFTMD